MENEAITNNGQNLQLVPVTITKNNGEILRTLSNKEKKKRPTVNIIRAAMFMIRSRTNDKKTSEKKISQKKVSSPVTSPSKGGWKKFVGAMRPLHHQQLSPNNSPPPPIDTTIAKEEDLSHGMFPTVILNSPSFSFTSSLCPSPSSPQSRYASAVNLQELDKSAGGSRYASAVNLQELDVDEEDLNRQEQDKSKNGKPFEIVVEEGSIFEELDKKEESNNLENVVENGLTFQEIDNKEETNKVEIAFEIDSNLKEPDKKEATNNVEEGLVPQEHDKKEEINNVEDLLVLQQHDKEETNNVEEGLVFQELEKKKESNNVGDGLVLQELNKKEESKVEIVSKVEMVEDGFEMRESNFDLSRESNFIEIGIEDGLNVKKRVVFYEETSDEDDNINHDQGDELIDSRADEFIAKFYEQMRLQQMNSAKRHN